jgi:exosortase A-associated hydrolase 1
MNEQAIHFDCQGERLFGVLTTPGRSARRGVLVIVGGPQYRAGSHRQFVLLARSLAETGVATLRFDYRGMGDSAGAPRSFDDIGDDLHAALEAFQAAVPGLEEIVLWGLCDGASAACLFASADPRIGGVVLLNPWVREEASAARATLKHYYWQRLTDKAFWRKLASGGINPLKSSKELAGVARRAAGAAPAGSLPERMLEGLSGFSGRVLVITSGNDLTAQEFLDVATASPGWRALLASQRATRHHIAEADHTFARQAWRDEVAEVTARWLSR